MLRRDMATERTLILVKPDAFARGLTGEIIRRFERKGLTIVALKHMQVTEDLAKQHYAEHDGKPFFGELVEFITSGPLVAMVLEGEEAIRAARQVIGATNPLEATTGSIRGDFAVEVGKNMVHGSDSPESGTREAGLFFPEL
jgi:nucleoside-diphosphate kinase